MKKHHILIRQPGAVISSYSENRRNVPVEEYIDAKNERDEEGSTCIHASFDKHVDMLDELYRIN